MEKDGETGEVIRAPMTVIEGDAEAQFRVDGQL